MRPVVLVALLAVPLGGCVGGGDPDVRMYLTLSHAVASEDDLLVAEAVVANLGGGVVEARVAGGCPPGIVFDFTPPGGAPFALHPGDRPCLVEPGPVVLAGDETHAARVEFNGTVWRHGVPRPAVPGEWLVHASWGWRSEDGAREGIAEGNGVFHWAGRLPVIPARLTVNATNSTLAPGVNVTAQIVLANEGEEPLYAEGGCRGPVQVEIVRLDPSIGLAYPIRDGPERPECPPEWHALPAGERLVQNLTWNGTHYTGGTWKPAPPGEYRVVARYEDDLGRVLENLVRLDVREA